MTKDELKLALHKAFDLGSKYWQQADSEYSSQWKKADATRAQLDQLIEDTAKQARSAPVQEPVAALDRIKEALPEFRQQDDYLLAHGASLLSEHSHEIIHIDTALRIAEATQPATPVQPVAWLIPGSITTDPELAKANGDKAVALGKISTQQWNPEDHYKDGWRDALESVKRATPPAAPVQQATCLVRRLDGVADLRRLEGDHDEAGVIDEAVAVLKAISPAAQPAPVQPVASLLLQSKQTFEHNFGPSSAADWIYSDMAELMGTTPPAAQRQWVGLRSEQYVDIARAISPTTVMGMKSLIPVWVVAYARAIEAELKEKNT